MGNGESMSKVQITLGLGMFSLVVSCVPCVGGWIYMPAFVATLVCGFLAHTDAKETGEDTTMAKVGMGLAVIPLILGVLLTALYICGVGGLVLADSM